jgi:hypothetical protein
MSRSELFSKVQPGGVYTFTDESKSTGEKFWVHSETGTDRAGDGRNPDKPFATIDFAVGQCTANQGDVIYVMPGHAETLAADASDIAVDVAGVSIIGLGNSQNRPVITFTHTGATVAVSAANCRVANLVFQNDVDSQTAVVTVTGAGCSIENCTFLEGSSKQYLLGVLVSTGASRATVCNCIFRSVAAGANAAIRIGAAVDRCVIEGCDVYGDFSDACIHNPTGNVATTMRIQNNILTNLQSGDHAIELVSACTGVIAYNVVNSSLAAAATRTSVDPGSCYCIENYGSDGVGDVNGVLNPAADS